MADATIPARWAVLGSRLPAGRADGRGHDARGDVLILCDADGRSIREQLLPGPEATSRAVQRVEAEWPGIRWVWGSTRHRYGLLLEHGIRVRRCWDLRLCRVILRTIAASAGRAAPPDAWDAADLDELGQASGQMSLPAPTLFDLDEPAGTPRGVPDDVDAVVAELVGQRASITALPDGEKVRMLCAAESAGALIAEEMQSAGLPWDRTVHEQILVDRLGKRSSVGGLPEKLAAAAADVRVALGDDRVNLDSPLQLLRALHRAGVSVRSTAKWELRDIDHPVVEPLLEYKRMQRLYTANGWHWLDDWVRAGRFRPMYIPAGVVTGRWAASGGGALQIPRQLRAAVRSDPGWLFVDADVAQLEPRVLAGMAGDLALADAARGTDLYAGIVAAGTVQTRAEAKVALLGAMYGATTGESGRLVPRLRRAYPRSMALVDAAARTGERGGVVSTRLGRTCPPPSEKWRERQRRAHAPGADAAAADRARREAGDRGRFTRNFIVQGTAAEWSLLWLAHVRAGLSTLAPVAEEQAARASGPAFSRMPHLAFFLHDELIVHTPAVHADAVARIVTEASAEAARLVFGSFPLDFPLDLRIADNAGKA